MAANDKYFLPPEAKQTLLRVRGFGANGARSGGIEGPQLVELPAGSGAAVAQHLGKYLIADDVTIEARPDLQAVTLFGSEAELELGAAALTPGAWTVEPATLFEIPVLADRRAVWGMAAYSSRQNQHPPDRSRNRSAPATTSAMSAADRP